MRSLAWLAICSALFGCEGATPRGELAAQVDAGLPAAEFTTAEDFELDAIAEFKGVTPDKLGDALGQLEAELQ